MVGYKFLLKFETITGITKKFKYAAAHTWLDNQHRPS